MNKYITIILLVFSGSVYAEGTFSEKPISEYTYRECLRDGLLKNQNLSADDIRSLCKEITARPEPRYEYKDGDLQPMDDFTKCYDKKVKETTKRGYEDAEEMAKLFCFYGIE